MYISYVPWREPVNSVVVNSVSVNSAETLSDKRTFARIHYMLIIV